MADSPLEREDYRAEHCILPELRHIGWSRFPHAAVGHLGSHQHEGFEICYLVGGSVDWWAGHEVYEVGPGQVYITRPGETHGGVGAAMNPCELYWLQIVVPGQGVLQGLSAEVTRELHRGLNQAVPRVFPGVPAMPALYQSILEEHRQPAPLSVLKARGALHQLLALVWRCRQAFARRHAQALAQRSGAVRRALALIEQSGPAELGVTQLAGQVGLGVSQFRALFERDTGFAPARYLMRRRLRLARQALAQGKSISRTAAGLGFSSSQHFATAFKQWVGMTPRAYRQMSRQARPVEPYM